MLAPLEVAFQLVYSGQLSKAYDAVVHCEWPGPGFILVSDPSTRYDSFYDALDDLGFGSLKDRLNVGGNVSIDGNDGDYQMSCTIDKSRPHAILTIKSPHIKIDIHINGSSINGPFHINNVIGTVTSTDFPNGAEIDANGSRHIDLCQFIKEFRSAGLQITNTGKFDEDMFTQFLKPLINVTASYQSRLKSDTHPFTQG